ERLAQIAQIDLRFPGDLAADFGVLVESSVEVVGAAGLLADDAGGAQDDAGARVLDLADDVLEALFEVLLGRAFLGVLLAVPDIVDADVDDDDGRLLGENVFLEASLQVRNAIAADAGADDGDVEIGVLFLHVVLDEGDVALGADAPLGDRVAEEDDALPLLQENALPRLREVQESDEQNCDGRQTEMHGSAPLREHGEANRSIRIDISGCRVRETHRMACPVDPVKRNLRSVPVEARATPPGVRN